MLKTNKKIIIPFFCIFLVLIDNILKALGIISESYILKLPFWIILIVIFLIPILNLIPIKKIESKTIVSDERAEPDFDKRK